MGEKLGWLGEKLAFGCGALFSWIVVVQGALTACRGGGWALFTLAGLGGMGALVLLGLRYLKPARAFSLGLFTLRLAIALGVVFLFGAQPVQDFKTMYDAACQLAQEVAERIQERSRHRRNGESSAKVRRGARLALGSPSLWRSCNGMRDGLFAASCCHEVAFLKCFL